MHVGYCASVSGGRLTNRGRKVKPRFPCVCVLVYLCILTFKPDHQWHLQLQLSTGLGDAVGDDGTVDDPAEDVDEDGLNL